MKPESKKSDVAILFALLLLVGGIFLWMYTRQVIKTYHDNQSTLRTTYSVNVEGTLLWYTLLERLHYDVTRIQEPLLHPLLQSVGVLCLLDPEIPLHKLEFEYLKKWVGEGGVLLCKAETDLALQELHQFPINDHSRSLDSSSVETPLRHIRSADFHKGSILSPPPESEAKILFQDHAGIRIAEKTIGQGRVIVLAEDSFLSNGRIQNADNSVLAIHLLDYAATHTDSKTIAFDEYHYGYGDTVSDWGLLLILLCTTKSGWALLCLMAAGALYLWYRGRRFGTQLALEKASRGSEMEYIAAAGELYRRAALNRRILQDLFQHLKMKLGRRYGVSPHASHSALISSIRIGAPSSHTEWEAIFNEIETAIELPTLSETLMNHLLQQLGVVERELIDEHPRSA